MGSNNWVVNGSHTKSGKPLLANDPHIAHSVPSVWYMIHLKAPGLNVTGVSLPGVPLVIIGHNEQIAWGVTNTAPDVQDLYAETFNPGNSSQYLHDGKWIDADVRDETINVRNRPDYHFTREGDAARTHHIPRRQPRPCPAMDIARSARSPIAVPSHRSSRQLGGVHLRACATSMYRCRTLSTLMPRAILVTMPPGLFPFANTAMAPSLCPETLMSTIGTVSSHSRIFPTPSIPASGMIATANGRIVPDDYPYFITARWDAPFRTARIFQLLRERRNFDPADMLRIQTDILSLEDQWLAEQLLNAASNQTAFTPDVQFALSSLKSWDGVAGADSTATLVLEVTRTALLRRILKPKLGDDLCGYHWPMSTTFLQNVLEQNLTRWLPPGDASFKETLMKSLDDGVRQIPAMVHSGNHAAWRWGDTIPLTFHHPLSALPLLGRWLDVGPFPQAGTGTTVKQTTPRLGPSMRIVVDFSDLDESLQNITLGESGQILSPYYRDQFQAWYEGKSFPMPFTDPAVEKAAVHKLVLEPQP